MYCDLSVRYHANLVKYKSLEILSLYQIRVSFLEWHFISLK
jgi:hypothetical protein